MPLDGQQSLVRGFACGVLCALATTLATWPLPAHLTTAIPTGLESVPTVPLLNLWTVWWNADRAAAGFVDYWNAPIFAPTAATFVFSEAQPTTLVVAPLVWARGEAILAYNVYFLISLTLNGVLTYRLLRHQRHSWWAAQTAAILVQTSPYIFWQLGVLQLTLLWPSLWTIDAALRWLQAHRWRTAVELAVAFAVTYASCNYYGLFLVVLLPPAALWFLRRSVWRPGALAQWVTAAVLAGVLIAPLIAKQRASAAEHRWTREVSIIQNLSAHARDYLDTPCPQWLDRWEGRGSPRHNDWTLGPGILKLGLALVGLGCGLIRPGRRRWTLFVLTFGGLAWLFSLGLLLEFWTLSPYGLLRDYVPGFAQIRSPFRFAVYVHLAVAWLIALLIDGVLQLTQDRPRRTRWLGYGVVGLITFVTITETRPGLQTLYRLPGTDPLPAWVEFLRDETAPEETVACLPFPAGTTVDEYEQETLWMYWSMFHRRRLLNGYSGYFPQPYLDLRGALAEFPGRGADQLRNLNATWVVIDRNVATQRTLAAHPATRDWEWRFSDEFARIDIYRLP